MCAHSGVRGCVGASVRRCVEPHPQNPPKNRSTQADTKVHRLAPRSRAREEVCGVAPLSKVAEIKTTALRRPSAPTGADGQPTACR